MKKFYRITLLLIIFIFLSTYNPKEFNLISNKSKSLFKIQNIEIKNNFLINKSEIKEKLSNIRKENIFFIKRKDIEEPLKEIDFLKKIEVKKLINYYYYYCNIFPVWVAFFPPIQL